jgi:hypothetical protein
MRSAEEENGQGVDLADDRRYAEAVPHYLKARDLSPNWWMPWANLAVAYKHVGAFHECQAACLRALELNRDKAGTGTLWNLAVAATALGDWERARWAWTECGIAIPAGQGPIDMPIGTTPIRVSVKESPEVVWTTRIDPARAIIENIPFASSGRRYRDLLLHDGEPRGYRYYDERKLSVFDELALLEPSPYGTWRVFVHAPTENDIDALVDTFLELDGALEDWTGSREILCKQCSEGEPHEHEERSPSSNAAWEARREVAFAARTETALAPLHAWAKQAPGRAYEPAERLV